MKTFLQLLKLLFSLSGVLVAFSSATAMDLMSESDGTLMQLIGVLCYTAAVVLLIPCRATCYVHKCRLSFTGKPSRVHCTVYVENYARVHRIDEL